MLDWTKAVCRVKVSNTLGQIIWELIKRDGYKVDIKYIYLTHVFTKVLSMGVGFATLIKTVSIMSMQLNMALEYNLYHNAWIHME